MRYILISVALALATPVVAQAQSFESRLNFADRQAIEINNAAGILELSGFSFGNVYERSRFRLNTSLSWKNVSQKPITAFEVVILRYDPFNRPIRGGGTWMVTGKNSGDWRPLAAGESSADGLSAFDSEPVLTSVAYVRAVRFQDGAVWKADIADIERQIQTRLPELKDLGEVSPESQKEPE